jgi:CRISPR-associated protein Cmr2
VLSELSKAAAKSILQQKGDLIFPSATDADLEPGSAFNVVNKILAEITGAPEIVGNKIKDAVEARLKAIADTSFRNLEGLPTQFVDLEKAKLQVSEIVEYYWTAVEHLNSVEYRGDRDQVEKLSSARKVTRDFKQVNLASSDKENSWGDYVPKSSLDGQRESVILDGAYDEFKSDLGLRIRLGVKKGERLCGIGLLKRHGRVEKRADISENDYQDRFFSTSHVASLPFLERLKKRNACEETHFYKESISRLLEEIDDKDLYKIVGRVPKNLEHEVFGGSPQAIFTNRS